MKKQFIFILISVVSIMASCTTQPKLDNSLLWKISGNGLTEDSYLFGTNYQVHYSFLDSINGFWNIYNSAKNFVTFGATKNSISDQDIINMFKENLLLPKDTTYSVLYSPEDYKIVEEYLVSHGYPNLKRFNAKPAFITFVVYITMIYGYFPDVAESIEDSTHTLYNSIEPYLLTMSKEKGKNVIKIEDSEIEKLFLNMFYAPLKEQAEVLLETIKGEDIIINSQKASVSFYKQQNLEGMVALDKQLKKQLPKTYSVFNYNLTNKIKGISNVLKSGSSLIAVEVELLLGEEGLINLLRKAGYTVEPVK